MDKIKINEQLLLIKEKKNKAVKEQDFEKLAELRDQEKNLLYELEKIRKDAE